MAERVGGLIAFKADGAQYLAKGNFTYNMGKPKRESVMGADGFHGFKEAPQIAFIEGEITMNEDTDTAAIADMVDVTVTLDLADGTSFVLSNAYYAHEGTHETEEGKFPIRFEGEKGEIV